MDFFFVTSKTLLQYLNDGVDISGLDFIDFKFDGTASRRPVHTKKLALSIFLWITLNESILFKSGKRSQALITPDSKYFL